MPFRAPATLPAIAAATALVAYVALHWSGTGMIADSWAYWEGAISLATGHGYTYFSGNRIEAWPPLYSAYLAAWTALAGPAGWVLVAANAALLVAQAVLWRHLALVVARDSGLSPTRPQALLVSLFVYRDLTLPQVYKLLIRSAMTTAVIMLVIAMSAVLSWTLSSWQVPGAIAQSVLSLSTNPYVIMLLVVAVILLTGVFIETASALIILTPVLLPLVLQLGIDPIHFGLIIVVGLSIGMITPPVAINLYVASSVTQLPLERITQAILPYLLGLIGVLLLVVYVPILLGWSGH